MKIAVIDDYTEDARELTCLCQNWACTHNAELTCDYYPSGEDFLAHFTPGKYQLLFMDIYLENLSGIETAQLLREQDINCLLVFLTTSREHTWDSFPLHPFDYLLKPCDPERIAQVLSEALRVLPELNKKLELTFGRQKIYFPYNEMIALESDGHYVRVTSVGRETLRCYVSSFGDLWNILCQDPRFLLCNRGIILNMDYIKKYSNLDFIMKNGQRFPIRQNKRNAVMETFFFYQYKNSSTPYHESPLNP